MTSSSCPSVLHVNCKFYIARRVRLIWFYFFTNHYDDPFLTYLLACISPSVKIYACSHHLLNRPWMLKSRPIIANYFVIIQSNVAQIHGNYNDLTENSWPLLNKLSIIMRFCIIWIFCVLLYIFRKIQM